MTADAQPSDGTVPPSRSLQRVPPRLPATRPAAMLATIGARALPVVASSVATGLAVLAAEHAVRSLVRGATSRALGPVARQAAPQAPFMAVYTEWTIIERVRFRR
jgi:hypothetical protein